MKFYSGTLAVSCTNVIYLNVCATKYLKTAEIFTGNGEMNKDIEMYLYVSEAGHGKKKPLCLNFLAYGLSSRAVGSNPGSHF